MLKGPAVPVFPGTFPGLHPHPRSLPQPGSQEGSAREYLLARSPETCAMCLGASSRGDSSLAAGSSHITKSGTPASGQSSKRVLGNPLLSS